MAVSLPPYPRLGFWLCTWLVLAPGLAAAEAPAAHPTAAPAPAVPAPLDVKPAAAPSTAVPSTATPAATHETGTLGTPGAEEEPESLGWTLVRTLFMLGAVVASIYLTLNVGLRKLMGLQGVSKGRASVVSVVERVPLDQRRTLYVLKAAGEYLLVGGGEEGLQLLSKLDTAAVEQLHAEQQRPASSAVPMTPFLQKLLTRRTGSTPPSA